MEEMQRPAKSSSYAEKDRSNRFRKRTRSPTPETATTSEESFFTRSTRETATTSAEESRKQHDHPFTYENEKLIKRKRLDVSREIGCFAFHYEIKNPLIKYASEYTLITKRHFVRGCLVTVDWKDLENLIVDDMNLESIYVRGIKEVDFLSKLMPRIRFITVTMSRDFNDRWNRYCSQCGRGCSYQKAKSLLQSICRD
jgi:hypothetical protein